MFVEPVYKNPADPAVERWEKLLESAAKAKARNTGTAGKCQSVDVPPALLKVWFSLIF